MDFKDWRQNAARLVAASESAPANRYRGQHFSDYIDEQIRAAEERGEFRNLHGMGQPLKLDVNPYAGAKALGYSLLKSNGYAPAEIELARAIRLEEENLEARIAALSRRGRELCRRRIPPFASEKRAYNQSVNRALAEYEAKVRDLNRKILTLNLSTPSAMHRSPLDVERMVKQFRAACPLFA